MRRVAVATLVAVPFLLGAASSDGGPQRHEVFRFTDPDIVESSGLAVVPGAFVTVNDSGDSPRVFSVDPQSGRTVGVTHWAGDATDDEALAPSTNAGFVWVGDLGDNTASRPSISVVEVPVGGGDRVVEGRRYTLAYPHGRATDAETLLSDPVTGRLFVVTKGVFGGVLYAAPPTLDADRVNRLRPRGRVLGIATDGAFFPDGRHLIIRDYSQAVVYDWPSLDAIASVRLPKQQQGEGIAVDPDGRVFVSSEGLRQPVYRVPLPRALESVVNPEPVPAATPTPVPPDGRDVPQDDPVGRDPWQWLLGTAVLVGAFAVLLRALRPR